ATRARRCAASSRSMPSTSPRRRCTPWRAPRRSPRSRSPRRSPSSVSTPTRPSRAFRERKGSGVGLVDLSLLGWIVVGFIAGALSAAVVPGIAARGCLSTILVGVLGGILGGFLARALAIGDPNGLLGAIVLAFVGAVIVRIVLEVIAQPSS